MLKPIVSSKWLFENLSNPDLILLDASPSSNVSGLKSDLDEVQIVGSRYFDLKKKFSDKNSELPNTLLSAKAFEKEARELGINQNSKIVIYDNLGIYTSPRVWWMFKIMGHQDVAVLNGGLPDWVKKKYETESIQQHKYAKGNFKAALNKEMVLNFEEMQSCSTHQEAVIFDARSKGRFEGTAPEPRAGLRSGNIPNSLNLPWKAVLKNGKFKSKKALREIFSEAKEGESIVFSCGSGLTACIILLAAELVNDNPKSVYDGSWTEWAQRVG